MKLTDDAIVQALLTKRKAWPDNYATMDNTWVYKSNDGSHCSYSCVREMNDDDFSADDWEIVK